MIDGYVELSSGDKVLFMKAVNSLLFHTFITLYVYDAEEGRRKTNPEYLFADRCFPLLEEYLSVMGIILRRDENYGVIYASPDEGGTRERLDKFTTQLIYMLRLIYDEERDNLSLSADVVISLAAIVQRMISLSLFQKKPSNDVLRQSIRKLQNFRIISRLSGSIEKGDAKYIIHPTILFIVTNEKIATIARMIDEDTKETDDEEA